MQLDDWVLCRIYNKKGTLEKYYPGDQKTLNFQEEIEEEEKPKNIFTFAQNGMLAPTDAKITQPQQQMSVVAKQMTDDILHFETSESVPRFHTDSSGSEQVLSPDFAFEKEVQSAPKWSDLERALDFQLSYADGFQDDPFASNQMQQYNYQFYPSQQDVFMYMQ